MIEAMKRAARAVAEKSKKNAGKVAAWWKGVSAGKKERAVLMAFLLAGMSSAGPLASLIHDKKHDEAVAAQGANAKSAAGGDKPVAKKGILAAGESVQLMPGSLLGTIKNSSGPLRVIDFGNVSGTRGRVEALVLVRQGAQKPMVKMMAGSEMAVVEAYLLKKDQLEARETVDFSTIDAGERALLGALAVKLGGEREREVASSSGFGVSDVIGILMIGLLMASVAMSIKMARGNAKSIAFIEPNDIKGSMSDLVGMADIKAEVLRIKKFLNNRQAHGEYGIKKAGNVLFSGPPGTGKTKLAGYLAKELGLPILFMSAANLETGFVAGGGQTLDKAVALAKKRGRCVIFLDEAQDLFMRRGGNRKFDDDTQNTLLSMLDGVRSSQDAEIIWIVASNFNSAMLQMDEAMLRRFPLKIDFRLPNETERSAIFERFLSHASGKVAQGVDLAALSEMTAGCSPADIESIVQEAAMSAIDKDQLIDEPGLARAFERYLMGNTDEETTKGREADREVIALHEVGHFLIDAIRCCEGDLSLAGGRAEHVGALKISLKANARSNALGFVLKKPRANLLQTKRDLEWEVMGLFGGMANEEIFFGEEGVTNGAYGDIQEVTKLLANAVSGLGIYKEAKLNFTALGERLAGEVSEEDREAMKQVSQRLFSKTKAMLEERQDLSRFLADALIERVEIRGVEMARLISEFYGQQRPAPVDLIKLEEGQESEEAARELSLHDFLQDKSPEDVAARGLAGVA